MGFGVVSQSVIGYYDSMSLYYYREPSPIQEVAFHTSGQQPPVALIAGSDKATAEQLSSIRQTLQSKGWECLPVTIRGKDILQVSGFGSDTSLRNFLAEQKFATGTPEEIHETAAYGDRKTFLQRYSLQLAGILNLIGDIGFLGSGIKKKDPYKITGGSLYTLGGANLTLFGGTRPDRDMRELTEDTAAFVKDKMGHLDADTGLAKIDANRQGDRLHDKLYRNAAQNTLGVYTAGAGAMLVSGIKQYRRDPKEYASMWYGISSVVFKVASFLIPEKVKTDEGNSHKRKGIVTGAIDWVREKPLRLFGYGSVVTDSLLALGTYQEYQASQEKISRGLLVKPDKNFYWSGITATTYILADFMIAVSSKDHANASGSLDPDHQRRIEALAVESILRTSEAERPKLTLEIAEFLASRPNMKGSASDINNHLQLQIEEMGKNRWANRIATSKDAVAAEAQQQPVR
jgi:hypothetical protein